MPVRSAGRSRERVVAFGPEGVGKSLLALDIAANLPPGVLMFVIDNDNAWDRMLEGTTLEGATVKVLEEWRWVDGEFVADDEYTDPTGNLVVFHVDGWVANTEAIALVGDRGTRDDWCCIDSGSALWDDVQAWFTEEVFSTDMADYFLEVRLEKVARKKKAIEDEEKLKAAKTLGALDGWMDWPVINATYKRDVMKFLVNPPCHLIVTAEQAEVTKEDTDKETRTLYGADVKARGQKRIGHNVQTVLRLRREQNGNHKVWTLKDRGGRAKLVNEDVTDRGFVDWYLIDVAGWTWEDDEVQEVQWLNPPPMPPAAKAVIAKAAAPVTKAVAKAAPAMTKGG